jgi:hypothetical protein
MAYAEVKDEKLIKYPYGLSELQSDNPNTDFGENPNIAFWFPQTSKAIANKYTLVDVTIGMEPDYNLAGQICTLNETPIFLNGIWLLNWVVKDFTSEQQSAYYDNVVLHNKFRAQKLLSVTEWSTIDSITNPVEPEPYLINKLDFLTYRSLILEIANNPTWNAIFPSRIEAAWSS